MSFSFVIFFRLKSSLSGNNIVNLACCNNIFLVYVIWLAAYSPQLMGLVVEHEFLLWYLAEVGLLLILFSVSLVAVSWSFGFS